MPLAPGTRIGRIRVDSMLGAGGMGEVWRGWDEKLERAVALKVVHSDKRVHAAVRTRFLREARVLSQLDHPNICRIYDVLERSDGDYLVLELVEGTTLREKMEHGLTRTEALDVALQVARVLAVTHARGIVHRDLKPDNIMLTPSGQVKVLDFGLARAVGAEREWEEQRESLAPLESGALPVAHDLDAEHTAILARSVASTDVSRTSAGSLVGTLHYMSPEQARGLPITEASDVYSLGIVLYELLARRNAYGPVESMNDLLLLVRKAEVVPFEFHDRILESLLESMLALQPADRATAAQVVREVERIGERPARRRRRTMAAVAALAVLGLVAGSFFLSQRLATSAKLFSRPHGRIAILPFSNATRDPSLRWIESGLADLVAEGTRRARGADVVGIDTVMKTMKSLGLSSGAPTGQQRTALLEALGADVLIAPVVTADEGKYTIHYAALTRDREEAPREATSTVLVEAARRMSIDLAERIDPASVPAARAQMSLDNTANTLYAMGMQELRTRGPKVAAHYFTVCMDRDPEFLAAQVQLADCRKSMAENDEARRMLEAVLAKARARNDRTMLARGLLTKGDWAVDDGNYAEAETSAREAQALARAAGETDIAGRAFGVLGYAAWRTGRLDEARRLFEEGLQIFARIGNSQQEAQLHNNLGVLADSIPDPAAAEKHFLAAAALADRMNDRYLSATLTGNLGMVHARKGDFARAEQLARRQVALTREIGDAGSEIFGLTNLGLYLWAQGKEAEGVAMTREAAVVAAKVGNRRVETVILSNLATAETKLGDLAAARTHNAAALRILAGLNDPEVARDVELGIAYTAIREGRLEDAARALDRSESWRSSDRCTLYRARLAYAKGEYPKALALAKKAKAENEVWLIQSEQMLRAFEESARTGKPATLKFEEPLR